MKKLLAVILAVVMSTGFCVNAFAIESSSLPESNATVHSNDKDEEKAINDFLDKARPDWATKKLTINTNSEFAQSWHKLINNGEIQLNNNGYLEIATGVTLASYSQEKTAKFIDFCNSLIEEGIVVFDSDTLTLHMQQDYDINKIGKSNFTDQKMMIFNLWLKLLP